jgi:hypothetical protein
MPCTTQKDLTPTAKQNQSKALARLDAALALGTITVTIGRTGAISFKGFQDNAGVSDICAYRALLSANSAALRKAIARAEAVGGVKLNPNAIAAGVHSHDGGYTWGTH